MIKIEVERVTIKPCPKIILGADCYDKIGNIVIDGIQSNIMDQQQSDGYPIKKNAQSTVRRKEILGQSPIRSLVDRLHRFVKSNSFMATITTSSATIEPRSSELKEISIEVQKKGYTGWFGIRPKWRAMISETIKRTIQDLFK